MSNSVIVADYNISGNGKKITKLVNGWLVAIALSGTTLKCYVSKDDNVSWTQLCSISYVNVSPAIVSVGNVCYIFYTYNNVVYVNSFDATTQDDVNISAYKAIIETVTSLKTGLSAAFDPLDGMVYVAYSAKTG